MDNPNIQLSLSIKFIKLDQLFLTDVQNKVEYELVLLSSFRREKKEKLKAAAENSGNKIKRKKSYGQEIIVQKVCQMKFGNLENRLEGLELNDPHQTF